MSDITDSIESCIRELQSDLSKRAYRDDWNRYAAWLSEQGIEITKARPRNVKDYISHLTEEGKARSSCGRALSVIKSIYAAFVRDEIMETNPAREVKNVKIDQMPHTPYLEEDQVRVLLALPASTWRERRDRVCVCLLFGLGFRRSEIARMKMQDFVRHGERVEVSLIVKGGKKHTAGVPAWVVRILDEWCKFAGITNAILPRSEKNMQAINGDIVYNIVKGAESRAGLPKGSATPHGLRRSNITLGGARGVSLKDRQLSVGHASSNTTERYDRARDAAKNAPGQVFEDLAPPEEDEK